MAKILIVDDEATFVKLAQIKIEAEGHEVITATDGKEGLEKAKSEKPDLIILDVVMPKIDGYQICRSLKKDAKFKKIPIILFTGKAKDNFQVVGQKVGANVFMRKSADFFDLLAKIEELLKKSK